MLNSYVWLVATIIGQQRVDDCQSVAGEEDRVLRIIKSGFNHRSFDSLPSIHCFFTIESEEEIQSRKIRELSKYMWT